MQLKAALNAVGVASVTLACTTMIVAPQAVVGLLSSGTTSAPPSSAATAPYDTVTPPEETDEQDPWAPAEEPSAEEPPAEEPPAEPPVEERPAKKKPAEEKGEGAAPVAQAPLVTDDYLAEVEEEAQTFSGNSQTPEPAPFSFGLVAFNILGSNHTQPGGDKSHFAPGTVRTEWAVSWLADKPNDIIGFSEIQRDQLSTFMRATRGAYDAWPADELGGVGVPQTMVWRTSMFTAVEKRSVTIPFMNQQRPQPYVRLRHNATGREFWVMNVHNAPRDREAERDRAQALELAIIEDLRATGLPVFFIGDMNDKAEIFCLVTGRTDLYSPLGGSNDGACRPPGGMRVDWIFGSSDAEFADFRDDKSTTVRRITDHAVLLTRVTIP